MKKCLLPAAIALGIVFDFLFWNKTPGVSFVVFVVLCLAVGFLLLRTEKQKPARWSLLLLVPILFCALMTAVRREPFTTFLNLSVTLFSLAMLAVTCLNGLWVSFNLVDYVANFFHLIGGVVALPCQNRQSTDKESDEPQKRKKNLAPILRGIALSLPVWLLFLALFYSADLVFAERLDRVLSSLNLENLAEYAVRAIQAALVAYFFSGAVLFASRRSGQTHLTNHSKPLVAPFLGMTETSILLGGVLLIFGAFVLVQFRYFFFGQANIHSAGFTYAEYARRGFGELVAAAMISTLLLKGLSLASKKEKLHSERVFTLLAAGLVALALIILLSAFQRLFLYESAYGFTRLRTYAHVLMVWLGIFLASLALMEIFRRQKWFLNAFLLVLAGFILTLNLLNVDGFIAGRNISRAKGGEVLDAGYLASLSADAVPVLAESYLSGSLNPDVREGIGGALVCFQWDAEIRSLGDQPWQSFHFADKAALSRLENLADDLAEYSVDDEAWPVVVTSPRGIWYPCGRYADFD